VTAVYLLNYAENGEQMLNILRNIRNNLSESGRFVAFTINYNFSPKKSNFTKYGLTVLKEEPVEEGYAVEAELHTNPPFIIKYFKWNQSVYEWALKEAGFLNFAWHSIKISPEAMEKYEKGYWQDFLDNSLIIALSCGQKC